MKILNFKDFMRKCNLKTDTMNESKLQRVYKYPIDPRGSKIYSDMETKYPIQIIDLRHQTDHITNNKMQLFKEYVGEQLLNPFISYSDMETKYPIQIIDLSHQTDHITPKKIQLFQEYGASPDNARLFSILIRRREIELISDGNKLIEVRVISKFNIVYSLLFKY